jgi:hypothetical protein
MEKVVVKVAEGMFPLAPVSVAVPKGAEGCVPVQIGHHQIAVSKRFLRAFEGVAIVAVVVADVVVVIVEVGAAVVEKVSQS